MQISEIRKYSSLGEIPLGKFLVVGEGDLQRLLETPYKAELDAVTITASARRGSADGLVYIFRMGERMREVKLFDAKKMIEHPSMQDAKLTAFTADQIAAL